MDFEIANEQAGVDKHTPPSEVARKLIKSVVDPYIELEQEGLVKGVRIVVFGSLISRLKQPKDYDLLILFDDFVLGEKGEQLSGDAKKAMNNIFASRKDDVKQSNTLFVFPEAEFAHADQADISITSVDNFKRHLNENIEEKKKEAIQQLLAHPMVIYRKYVPDDRILDSDPGIDYETIDKTVLYSLIMARGFGYKLEISDIHTLMKYSRDFAESLRDAEVSERPRLTDEFIENNMLSLLTQEQIKVFKKGLKNNGGEVVKVLGELTTSFVEETDLSDKFKDRILWLYEMLKGNMNSEELQVLSGRLVYGDNIVNKGKAVFIEDRDFFVFD